MDADFLIVGGGSAGCVLAARLSEDPGARVLLLEAGRDYAPGEMPADIRDTASLSPLGNPGYFWPRLQVRRGEHPLFSPESRKPFHYEQAKVIGGGSSINGQVSLRGAPDDYRRWKALGADGWDWEDVLPYFKKIESDGQFPGEDHGADGPIPIRRFDPAAWDKFTASVVQGWEDRGYRLHDDMNADYLEGYSPLPLANDGTGRVSSAYGYLTDAVRRRPNLEIRGETRVTRILIEDGRATGVEYRGPDGTTGRLNAGNVVMAAGALHTPWLLMLSGIGPGEEISGKGVGVIRPRKGVGRNLQDHVNIAVSAYIRAPAREASVPRRNFSYLRYSSGLPDCEPLDLYMMAICRSAWHAIGARLGTISTSCAKTYSRGHVGLHSHSPDDQPLVDFNRFSDARDLDRLVLAFRIMADMFQTQPVDRVTDNPFPSSYSAKVRKIGRRTVKNKLLTDIGASIMDASGASRRAFIRHFIAGPKDLRDVLASEEEASRHVANNATSSWHVCGTCRMGSRDDDMAVVDPGCAVIGVSHLYVGDASIIPEIPRSNINLPTMMIAEKLAATLGRL